MAEDLIFHSITTGASNDIEQATKLARAMITRFGMSDSFGMVALETVGNQYLGGDASLACSPETATEIDRKVIEVVKTQYQKAENLLRAHMKELNSLAQYLYIHETITGEEFMDILNESLAQNQTQNQEAPDRSMRRRCRQLRKWRARWKRRNKEKQKSKTGQPIPA